MIAPVQAVSAGVEREFRSGAHARDYFQDTVERQAEMVCNLDDGFEVPGYGNLLPDVLHVLQRRHMAKVKSMMDSLPGIARRGGERYRVVDREGGGEWQMQVHPTSYHYWGQRLGYECWDDPEFCREYTRDNEYARVRNLAKNASIGWTPVLEHAQGDSAAQSYLTRKKKLILKSN